MNSKYIILILIFVITSCKSNKLNHKENEILEIGETRTCGDKGGKFYSTKIKKDSTITISGSRGISDTLKIATDKSKWKKLTEILNKRDFVELKVRKNIGQLTSDGCINYIYIKTNDSTIIRNGYNINHKNIAEINTISELME